GAPREDGAHLGVAPEAARLAEVARRARRDREGVEERGEVVVALAPRERIAPVEPVDREAEAVGGDRLADPEVDVRIVGGREEVGRARRVAPPLEDGTPREESARARERALG